MKAMKLFIPMIAIIAATFCTDVTVAQRGGFAGGGNNILLMAMRDDVREELNLVEDQIEELDVLQDEFRDEIRSMMSEMRQNGGGMDGFRDKVKEMSTDFTEKAEEIFLEEQLERLKQITFQANMARDPGLTLKERFDLTDEQVEEFQEARRENQEKAQKEIAEVMEKYQDEALSVLPSDVQEEIKKARGETFAQARQQRQRGGGQRGGGGGQRGGGQRGGGGGGGQRGGGGGGGDGRPRADF